MSCNVVLSFPLRFSSAAAVAGIVFILFTSLIFSPLFSGKSPCCPTVCLGVPFSCNRYIPLQLVGWKVGKVKVKLSLCMLRRHMRSGAHLHSFIISAVMGRVVGFTPWSPYFRGKSSGYPLIRTLGGSWSRSWLLEGEISDLLLPGIEPRFLGRPVRGLVTIPTTLLRSPEKMRKCFNFLMLHRFNWCWQMNWVWFLP